MILEFESQYKEKRVISKPPDIKSMWEDIDKFLKEHNFRSYYSRINFLGDKLQIDVGSHTEFFYVSEFNSGDLKDLSYTNE